jgi:hypothetical protein
MPHFGVPRLMNGSIALQSVPSSIEIRSQLCQNDVYGVMDKSLQGHWLFEADVAEIARKVGLTPEARLRWLVQNFAEHLDYSLLPPDTTPVSIAREASVFLLYQLGPGAFYMTYLPHLAPAVFEKLATEISEGLDLFIAGKRWTKRITLPVDRTVYRERDGGGRNLYRALAPIKSGFPAMFVLAAMDLLNLEGWRPTRCLGCNLRFVRVDRRQNYCGVRCSQTTRTRRLRAKPMRRSRHGATTPRST